MLTLWRKLVGTILFRQELDIKKLGLHWQGWCGEREKWRADFWQGVLNSSPFCHFSNTSSVSSLAPSVHPQFLSRNNLKKKWCGSDLSWITYGCHNSLPQNRDPPLSCETCQYVNAIPQNWDCSGFPGHMATLGDQNALNINLLPCPTQSIHQEQFLLEILVVLVRSDLMFCYF